MRARAWPLPQLCVTQGALEWHLIKDAAVVIQNAALSSRLPCLLRRLLCVLQ